VRVLLVSDWMTNAGGAEAYVLALRDSLRAAGDDVVLLTCGAGEAGRPAADARAYGADHAVPQSVLQIVNPFAVRRIGSVVRNFRPDVALVGSFAYHLSPAVLGVASAVPTVVSVTDYKIICPIGSKLLPTESLCSDRAGLICARQGCVGWAHWLRDQPRYALIASRLARVDRVLTCSRWVQHELALAGVSSEVLPPPVAPPLNVRRKPAESPVFVYVGRLSREKGVGLLLRAFAQVRRERRDARLRVVGDGPERSRLEALVVALELGSSVTFTGRLDSSGVDETLQDAWALVAPSLWTEPYGLVAPEAVLRGVPVVASATGGFCDTIEDGVSGLLFPNGDEAALGGCLRAIADGEVFPSHVLAPDVVSRVAELRSPARYVDRLHAVFTDIVARRREGARPTSTRRTSASPRR